MYRCRICEADQCKLCLVITFRIDVIFHDEISDEPPHDVKTTMTYAARDVDDEENISSTITRCNVILKNVACVESKDIELQLPH